MTETPSAGPGAAATAGDMPANYLYLPLAAHRIEDEASLIDYWRAICARKWLVLGIALAIAILVAVVFMLKDPVYEAEIHLLHNDGSVSSSSGSASGGDRESVQSTSTATTSIAGTQEEAIAILLSRQFTTAFIDEHQLLPVLYADRWDAQNKTWKGKPPTLWDAYTKFNEKIREVETDKDGVVIMTISWQDPVQAAEWANVQISRLNEFLRKRDIARAHKTLDYLNSEVAKTEVTNLQQSLYGLIEQYLKIIATANVTEEYAFTLVDPAVKPEEQVWTTVKKVVIVAFSFVTALFLAALLALFLGFLDRQRHD